MRDDEDEEDDEVDYVSLLAIDEMNLDREWIEHPKRFFTWARKLADARAEMDACKDRLAIAEADASKAIRADPEFYDIKKVTEAAIKAAIPSQKLMQRATKRYNEAKHTVDVLQAFVTSLDHRKRALEKLVDLHGQSYFAVPRMSEDNQSRMDDKTRERIKVRKKGRRHVED